MAIFGRRQSPGSARLPIPAFWQWWAESGSQRVSAALEARDLGEITGELSERVAAIDPGLEWELGAGADSAHTMTVCAAGNATLRRTAERWARAAPTGDAVWSYASSRAADQHFDGTRLELAGRQIAFDEFRVAFGPDSDSTRLRVAVHHPVFGELDDTGRSTATFLMLDALLGEDDVERWLGHIESSATSVGDDRTAALRRAVADLAARRPAEEQWTLARGSLGDAVAVVRTQQWLRWIDAPLHDLNSRFTISYSPDERGMPAAPDSDRMASAEDQLVAATTGLAQFVTVVTSAGRRTFDLYSDSEDQNTTVHLAAVAKKIGATIEQVPDPTWRRARLID